MFLKARFSGRRFEDHSIPLKMMAKLPVLQQIFDALVEHEVHERFGDTNPKSLAKLKGTLVLDGLEENDAITNISIGNLANPPQLADDSDVSGIYASARANFYDTLWLINTYNDAEPKDALNSLPTEVLEKLTKLGSGLTSDVRIEFLDGDNNTAANYDVQTLKTLRSHLNTAALTFKSFAIIVKIPELNLLTKTFTYISRNGSAGKVSYQPEQEHSIKQIFLGFDSDQEAEIRGKAALDEKSGTLKDAMLEELTPIENRNTVERLKEFKQLRDGWLDGLGIAPKPKALQWLINQVRKNFPADMLQPYCYPTPEGGVQMEWSIGAMEVSFTINLDSRRADLHGLQVNNNTEFSENLDIDDQTTWKTLVAKISSMTKEQHA